MPKRTPSRRAGDRSTLETQLGYTFADPALLRLALTHRSHTYESTHGSNPEHEGSHRNAPGSDNEQLEFLGDAVLGMLVTEALLREFPGCSEGELTRMRASLVSRARMADFGRELNLGDHILLGKGVEGSAGRTRPALLANAAEALLAAILLDRRANGKDPLPPLRGLLQKRLIGPDLPGLHAAVSQAPERGALRDSKTLLQESVQSQNAGRLRYSDVDQSGPAHDRRFTVQVEVVPPEGLPRALATAEGRSKKEAQQAAAAIALKRWQRQDRGEQASEAQADAAVGEKQRTIRDEG